MKPIPTIDAHHHIWRQADLPWLSGPPVPRIFGPYQAICRDYTIEEYRSDIADCNIVKSVYIQTNWPAGRGFEEAVWLQSVSDATGWPHANVAYADLADPDVATMLDRLAALPATRGIRQQLHWHENAAYRFAATPDIMNHADWRSGLALLEKHDLLFELQIFTSQMADGARLARDFPNVTFVLEHCGMLEDTSADGRRRWYDGMAELASCPNINVKLSGLGTFAHRADVATMQQVVPDTVALFGAARCLYGSNFPIEKLWTDYKSLYVAFRETIADLSDRDQHDILHGTAARLYRI